MKLANLVFAAMLSLGAVAHGTHHECNCTEECKHACAEGKAKDANCKCDCDHKECKEHHDKKDAKKAAPKK